MTARISAGNGEKPVAVAVDDLHKSFGQLEVLKGVSLTAREGDVVSMIGASGSGKSTFLRCINFLEMPTRGRIEVTGEQISLKRLDARPIATMTLEAQEKHERREKVHRDE